MRCRSTKEAGELVTRVLGDHDPRLDHAAIAMVRSPWWEEIPPTSWATEPWRGEVISRHIRHDGTVIRLRDCQDFVTGEILWK